MSESLIDALAGVPDRGAPTPGVPAPSEPTPTPAPIPAVEPSFFGRLPTDVLQRRDLPPGPKTLMAAIDDQHRRDGWRGWIDATDDQLARACGVSVNTIYRWLARLESVGLIERAYRTCRRIIRFVFRFRSASSPNLGGSPLPPTWGETSPNMGGNSPQHRGQLPPESGDSSKDKKKKKFKARSSPSSPQGRDTPTTAKTADTPPTSARPPLAEPSEADVRRDAEREAAFEARWVSLSPEQQARIEARVRVDYPWFSGKDTFFFRCLCRDLAMNLPIEATVEDSGLGTQDSGLGTQDSGLGTSRPGTQHACESSVPSPQSFRDVLSPSEPIAEEPVPLPADSGPIAAQSPANDPPAAVEPALAVSHFDAIPTQSDAIPTQSDPDDSGLQDQALSTLASPQSSVLSPSPTSRVTVVHEADVEVLPTDKELRSLKALAFAEDPLMRFSARQELVRLGRADIFRDVERDQRPEPGSRKARSSASVPRPVGMLLGRVIGTVRPG
jgi:hypothetical protein